VPISEPVLLAHLFRLGRVNPADRLGIDVNVYAVVHVYKSDFRADPGGAAVGFGHAGIASASSDLCAREQGVLLDVVSQGCVGLLVELFGPCS